MQKKVLVATLCGIFAVALTAIPVAIYASTNTETGTFIEKLSEKLGLTTETVQTAVESVRNEVRAENEAERISQIAQAVVDGKITQRQADILNAIHEYMLENRPLVDEQERTELKVLPRGEKRGVMRAEIEEIQIDLVNALNENGLNTNLDEVKNAQEAARSAELNGGKMVRKFRMGGFGL